ncbi:ImmA/IrrE family metallo-endopeptidase [Edaphobacter bradus]|uniref:ImmA/IrrE family metallo-endopeptidase n=1 Tax=Edaphobacter bradus TaxID=2259016 RepID=UPI0021E0DEC2|nr:ImmA/IrrE family metallo-endopeptidase [Edaphobacter bradus]
MVTKLKTEAARRALKSRLTFGYALNSPCDVFELVARYGLSLRFTRADSLDGLYINDGLTGSINVAALRPAGMQRFTAAHELGHFIFGHGARLDKGLEGMTSDSTEEMIADTFARHLLMPKSAVLRGFAELGTEPKSASAAQYHAVAAWLGVGYTTLAQQCRWTLGLIGNQKLHELTLIQPQRIKRSQVPSVHWRGRKELWPICPSWNGSRLHVQVGDVLTGLVDPPFDHFDVGDGFWIARRPGDIEVEITGHGRVQISIAREDYVGMYQYRYLEEEDEDA